MNAVMDPLENRQRAAWEKELEEIRVEVEREMEHLVTEDDTPVDNILSEKQQRLLTEPLYGAWPGPAECAPGHRRFLALANVGLFYGLREPPLVPDMMLALDVRGPGPDLSLKPNRSYFVWEQGGKPPVVAIEVVSNREGGEDDEKLRKYAAAHVQYYVIFDPWRQLSDRLLRIYQLTGQTYLEQVGGLFKEADLGLVLWQGEYEGVEALWLRWTDLKGRLIPTGAEQAEQERQRTEQERQRAMAAERQWEQEQMRATAAEQRLAQLMMRLREMGVDPWEQPMKDDR